ncbi:MAG: 2-methylcitrate dehydratase, partial [Alphaproteobacteria bacterium]|nr:2-methylcitrate dehydratase [Alphaproteobacteria bacterium]
MAEASHHAGPGAVEQLAQWVLAARAEDLSQATVTQAKLLLLDTIGCGFAALEEESARALLAVVETSGGAPQCTVIGGTQLTCAANATLANGALVRILDFNDYVNAKAGDLGGHPSDNIPVALAAGELCAATGIEIIAAIVLGYEIFGRAKDLMERDSAWDGVTVTGLAAPAMAGRLMRLDRHQLAHAIALSGARAATSTAVRFGDISAAKSIANALVAQNGVQAALLAQHGITGPLDLFENPRGMREVFRKGDAAAALTAPLTA